MNIKKIMLCIALLSISIMHASELNEITPYKFSNPLKTPAYDIPPSSRFTAPRAELGAPDIVYYLSKPQTESYPITMVCGGSSHKDTIYSIMLVHRYFLQEFKDLGSAVLTVEQWGVDGNTIDADAFMEYYTRSQRLKDHQAVIEHLKSNPPAGWNGQLIFFGISEGGPLVISLTTQYSDITRATINWVGAGDWSWRDELWAFIVNMRQHASWWMKLWDAMPRWMPFAFDIPKTRNDYDVIMDSTLEDPCVEKEFMGMTYRYHADALTYASPEYHAIRTPFLVVVGSIDPMIDSCDAFVEKARTARAPITYIRVPGMDHYVRTRLDIIEQTFEWLKQQLAE